MELLAVAEQTIAALDVPWSLDDQLHVGGFKRVTEAATRDWLVTQLQAAFPACAVHREFAVGVCANGTPGAGRADIVVAAPTGDTIVIELKVHSLAAVSSTRSDLEWRVDLGMGDWSYIGSVLAAQVEQGDSCVFGSDNYTCQQVIQWITHRVFDKGGDYSYFHYDTVENVVKAACIQASAYAGSIFDAANTRLSNGGDTNSVVRVHKSVATLAVVMIGQSFVMARGDVFQ